MQGILFFFLGDQKTVHVSRKFGFIEKIDKLKG